MFEVNQQVWDVIMGEGVVAYIHEEHPYPVAVKFSDDSGRNYTTDGRHLQSNKVPSLYPYPVEIVKVIKKPSINWGHVHSRFDYLAQDANGDAWLYVEKPQLSGKTHWSAVMGDHTKANSHASYVPGVCDWEESLVKRPD